MQKIERLRVIKIGRPGCGKGTFGRKVIVAGGFFPAMLPMSAELRALGEKDPAIAAVVKASSESGILTPDRIVVPAMLSGLKRIRKAPFMDIDGAPRNLAQLYALAMGLKKIGDNGNTRTIIAYIDTHEAICGWRLHARAAEEKRADDNPAAIVRRMEEFDQHTMPVVRLLEAHAMSTFGWEFIRFDGNDIWGNADMYLQLLDLPSKFKKKVAAPPPIKRGEKRRR